VRKTTAVLAAAAILAGCRGPTGPALTGTWSGFVHLYDEFGVPLKSDSGITVSALPTATISTTNDVGAYSFVNIPTGTYSLQYYASTFGTYADLEIQFVGGGTVNLPVVNLGQHSIGVITGLAMTPNAAGDTILATGSITPPPPGGSRYVRLFYSNANTVGSNVTLWSVTGPVFGHPYGVSNGTFAIVVTGQDLQALRNAFPSGTTVYVIAYGESYYENSYTDGDTGRQVYPNVCAISSNVVTFTMP
jgi:hypothetical protein